MATSFPWFIRLIVMLSAWSAATQECADQCDSQQADDGLEHVAAESVSLLQTKHELATVDAPKPSETDSSSSMSEHSSAKVAASKAAAPTHIIQIVVDDMGYNDIGVKNAAVETPTMDSLARGGVSLSDYYTFTVCAPSRASIMTGRYPWRIGYYWQENGKQGESDMAVDVGFSMLPKLLKLGGYETVAVGKWNCGYTLMEMTPTGRGFDEFFGYYHFAGAYWFGSAENYFSSAGFECSSGFTGPITDLSLNKGTQFSGATGQEGVYSTRAFSDYAVKRIQSHDASKPLYLYLAYHANHNNVDGGNIGAPLATVQRFTRLATDKDKVYAAALLEVDWGIGNVTTALRNAGMWENTVLVVVSDNGGSHGHNRPFRGEKASYWEGGIRGEAVIYSELLPKLVRGTVWPGLAHASDWYPTFVEGIAGLKMPEDTGPRSVDGLNLWPALKSGGDSPRTEVITQVTGHLDNVVPSNRESSIIRKGNYKLIIGNPGDDWLEVPAFNLSDPPISFGHTGGYVDEGTDHALVSYSNAAVQGDRTKCKNAPCLFNLKEDPSESVDLANKTGGAYKAEYAAIITNLTARLEEAATTGMDFSVSLVAEEDQDAAREAHCTIAEATGFFEPADLDLKTWRLSSLGHALGSEKHFGSQE